MSAQFGKWDFDGRPLSLEFIEKVSTALAPYGPDSNQEYCKDGVTILHRAFHTTKESHAEVQPHILPSGAVITFDGCLDNRKELIAELGGPLTTDLTDVGIVAATYERWGENCFAKLLGDWALSIWNAKERSLILAKDTIGTRHLYYWVGSGQITWGSVLDPIVRLSGKSFDLDKEYIAGLLSHTMYPASHLTPCVSVRSVPASSRVLLRPGVCDIRMYWDFDPEKKVRYRTDAEYEEHFRAVFSKAVQRKLRSDRPVLAELSGGRDSSSIVCVADTIMAAGQADCPRLDTYSCYDDSEPNWNERPYFSKVEEKRGRRGWHVNVGAKNQTEKPRSQRSSPSLSNRFVPTPGYDGHTSRQRAECLAANGNRVVLSGIGGDEVMGGVPTPTPELENLLARIQFRALAHQLKAWALQLRKPWLHLFWDAVRDFLPPSLVGAPKPLRPPVWLQSSFVKRHRAALTGYYSRTKLFGPLPSFQGNLYTLDHLRRQLSLEAQPFDPAYEIRYPFLERDLLEFMFGIPREQLVRPRQRRSLMRRALVGVVPDEILNRKRKASVSRAPLVAISTDWAHLMAITQNMVLSALGIVDQGKLHFVLQQGRQGEQIPTLSVNRALFVEGWLKNLQTSGYINELSTGLQPDLALQTSLDS